MRNTGVVFDALSERDGQLTDLISTPTASSRPPPSATRSCARRSSRFPTFEDESRAIATRLTRFANNANPLITQLRPAARQLSPTLVSAAKLAPNLKALFEDIHPLVQASRRASPRWRRSSTPRARCSRRLDPFLRSLNPFLDWFGLYKHETAAFFALDTAATQATLGTCDKPVKLCTAVDNAKQVHYLRTTNPVNPEALAAYPKRIATNRSNPYFAPLAYQDLAKGGLKVFGSYLCTTNPVPTVVQTANPLLPGVGDLTTLLSPEVFSLIDQFVYGGQPAGSVAAPPCREAAPSGNLLGQTGRYPHVTRRRIRRNGVVTVATVAGVGTAGNGRAALRSKLTP